MRLPPPRLLPHHRSLLLRSTPLRPSPHHAPALRLLPTLHRTLPCPPRRLLSSDAPPSGRSMFRTTTAPEFGCKMCPATFEKRRQAEKHIYTHYPRTTARPSDEEVDSWIRVIPVGTSLLVHTPWRPATKPEKGGAAKDDSEGAGGIRGTHPRKADNRKLVGEEKEQRREERVREHEAERRELEQRRRAESMGLGNEWSTAPAKEDAKEEAEKPVNPEVYCRECDRHFKTPGGLRAHRAGGAHREVVIAKKRAREAEEAVRRAEEMARAEMEVELPEGEWAAAGQEGARAEEEGARAEESRVEEAVEEGYSGPMAVEESDVVGALPKNVKLNVNTRNFETDEHLSMDERFMQQRRPFFVQGTDENLEDLPDIAASSSGSAKNDTEIPLPRPQVTQRTYETQGLGSWVPESHITVGGYPKGRGGRGIYPDDEAQPQREVVRQMLDRGKMKSMEEVLGDEELYQEVVEKYQGTAEGLMLERERLRLEREAKAGGEVVKEIEKEVAQVAQVTRGAERPPAAAQTPKDGEAAKQQTPASNQPEQEQTPGFTITRADSTERIIRTNDPDRPTITFTSMKPVPNIVRPPVPPASEPVPPPSITRTPARPVEQEKAEPATYCAVCRLDFPDPKMLARHLQSRNHKLQESNPVSIKRKKLTHYCESCDLHFKSQLRLVQHKLRAKCAPVIVPAPEELDRFCKECNKVFENVDGYNDHCASNGHKRKVKEAMRRAEETKKLIERADREAAKAEPEDDGRPKKKKVPSDETEWVQLTAEQQAAALAALQAQVHPAATLKAHHFFMGDTTAAELDGLRVCKNCNTTAEIIARRHITQCQYHPEPRIDPMSRVHSCCNDTRPCTTAPNGHSFVPPPKHLLDKITSYQHTPAEHRPTHRAAVAIDCEMGVARAGGPELLQLAAVDILTGETLLNHYVRPSRAIAHYNTRYSGVTRQDVEQAIAEKTALNTYAGARAALWEFVGPDTILVGHALRNDMDALRLVHPKCVSTEIVLGVGQVGLKRLAGEFCGIEIQKRNRRGHICVEDTLATREVVLWIGREPEKVKEWTDERRRKMEKEREENRERAMRERWEAEMGRMEGVAEAEGVKVGEEGVGELDLGAADLGGREDDDGKGKTTGMLEVAV